MATKASWRCRRSNGPLRRPGRPRGPSPNHPWLAGHSEVPLIALAPTDPCATSVAGFLLSLPTVKHSGSHGARIYAPTGTRSREWPRKNGNWPALVSKRLCSRADIGLLLNTTRFPQAGDRSSNLVGFPGLRSGMLRGSWSAVNPFDIDANSWTAPDPRNRCETQSGPAKQTAGRTFR